jgi:hypothetical protein
MLEEFRHQPIVFEGVPGLLGAAIGLRYILNGNLTSPTTTLDLVVQATEAQHIRLTPEKEDDSTYITSTIDVLYRRNSASSYHVVIRTTKNHVLLDADQYLEPDQWETFRKASQTLLVLGILDDDFRLIPSMGLVVVAQGHILWNF